MTVFPSHATAHPYCSHASSIIVLSVAVTIVMPIAIVHTIVNAICVMPISARMSADTPKLRLKYTNRTTRFQFVANRRLSADSSRIMMKAVHTAVYTLNEEYLIVILIVRDWTNIHHMSTFSGSMALRSMTTGAIHCFSGDCEYLKLHTSPATVPCT